MNRKTLGAAALTLTLTMAGCSSAPAVTPGATPASTSASVPVETATPTPTPTRAPLPAVSLQTTCTFLFGNDLDGPVPAATDIITRFIESPDLSTVTPDEMETVILQLDNASERAGAETSPFIDATSQPLKDMAAALDGHENVNISFEDYRPAGIELINQCRPYLVG